MFEQYTLKNGVSVILVPQKDTKAATTLIMYPVGSRYEPEYLSGVSHYIEHLMFKGTKRRKNAQILTREIDRLGAQYNAFTSKEYTGYYIKADAQYLPISLDILSDMLFNSVFDKKEMEREKGPIIEELRMYRDNPRMNIDNVFEELMYDGCALGRDIGGTEAHVRSYKRPEVMRFKEKYYCPANMTVVVAGAIGENTKKEIEKTFGKKQSRKKPSTTFARSAFGPAAKSKRLRVEHKETEQVQLMLGFPGYRTIASKENAISAVLNTILGGSMSSRLFIQVRERNGLAYTVGSSAEHYRDTGYMFVRAGLEAKNINKAMKIILKEIEKIKQKGVTKQELADAKMHMRGGLTLELEDSSAQANRYAHLSLFHKRIYSVEEELAMIDKVKNEDIKKVANSIYKQNAMRLAIIGNVEKKDIVF